MNAITVWAIVIGVWAADLPALVLRTLAQQVTLPAGAAEEWDAIGTYTLKGESATTTVKLYYEDSDSIAHKLKSKDGFESHSYPNFFCIHAIYREGDGRWKHKALFRVARVGFWAVTEVKPDAVTIQVRSKLILMSNSPIQFTDEEIERIYKPVAMRLIMKDGAPVLK